MKKLLLLFVLFTTAAYAQETKEAPTETAELTMAYYGEKITTEGAIDMETLLSKMGDVESLDCTVEGQITATCSKKGCWMTILSPKGEEMRVTFKDYGFFVPISEQEGKTAVMRGKAHVETTSVKMLKHFAEDAGKSKEEIEKITDPITNLTFEADGVIIYQ